MLTRDIELLKDAVNEIQKLRQQNSYMDARLSMFDDVMLLLKSQQPSISRGMSPDIVWEINSHIQQKTTVTSKLNHQKK